MKTLLESIIVIVPDLQYLRARYYDPNMGRFMQQDTLFGEMERPLTQNLYIYCLNNGVNLRDPSGNRSVDSIKSDVNRYKDQLASAKSAGAGQSVYDGIQKTIDSLIKELGNELSKPKPKPNPSPKPPKKPDWGDTSNPYNPVNNPNSAGSILSGADGYWGNGGGGSGESETDTSVPAITEWQRKLAEMYKNGQLGLMERAYFEKEIAPKIFDYENANYFPQVAPGTLTRNDYPNYPSGHKHTGTDFAIDAGTAIRTTRDGKVIEVVRSYPDEFNIYGKNKKNYSNKKLPHDSLKESWEKKTLGNRVVIEVIEGDKTYNITYAHMQQSDFDIVKVGQKVEQGSIIGYVGNTGNSSGNHLHFGVKSIEKSGSKYINPTSFLIY